MKVLLIAMAIVSLLLVASCDPAGDAPGQPAPAEAPPELEPLPEGAGTRDDPFVGRGLVREVGADQILIAHEMIPGYMAPMTMAFPVTGDVDLGDVAVGDQVRFNLELAGPTGYQIFAVDMVARAGTRNNPFVGVGMIEEIGNGELLINHEEIPGWMAPMTMAFPVTDGVDLGDFSEGDRIRFNVELEGPNGYRVFEIQEVN